jgi:hypothetical protein
MASYLKSHGENIPNKDAMAMAMAMAVVQHMIRRYDDKTSNTKSALLLQSVIGKK